jgi:hypothetical protein
VFSCDKSRMHREGSMLWSAVSNAFERMLKSLGGEARPTSPSRNVSFAQRLHVPSSWAIPFLSYLPEPAGCVGENTVFQSFFMLTTIQPFATASSQPLSKCWSLSVRSYANSRSASSW